MKNSILWVGDCCRFTGLGAVTNEICNRLSSWDVSVLGINYYESESREGNNFKTYPSFDLSQGGSDLFGIRRLPHLIQELDPDIVVILSDPWNVKGYLGVLEDYHSKGRKSVVMLPMDSVCAGNYNFNNFSGVIAWTEFGLGEVRKCRYAGGIAACIPLGTDFLPQDKEESRKEALPPHFPLDAFVVGVVGSNHPKKRIDLSLAGFAHWIKKYEIDNSYLYLKVSSVETTGMDLKSFIRSHNIGERVILDECAVPYKSKLDMQYMYSSFDVYLSTSQGEGWCLPALEAMACGTPCVLADWSGVASWAGDHAYMMECRDTAVNPPFNTHSGNIGGVVSSWDVCEALDVIYRGQKDGRNATRARGGRELAQTLTWELSAVRVSDFLDGVLNCQYQD